MIKGLKQALWRNRQLIVMAPESDSVQVTLYEETFRGPVRRFSKRFLLDQEEEPGTDSEGRSDWEAFLTEHQDESWVIILPHQATISQWMDLDVSESDQLEEKLQEQTERLVGLGESQIVIDYIQIPSPQADRSAYWITYCQESEIHKIIERYGLSNLAICDLMGSVDALLAGIQGETHLKGEWMLIDVRDGGTALVVFDGTHPRFSSFFPVGNEMAHEQGFRQTGAIRVRVAGDDGSLSARTVRKGIPMIAQEWGRDVRRAWQEYCMTVLKENEARSIDCPVLLIAETELETAWFDSAGKVLPVDWMEPAMVWKTGLDAQDTPEHRHWGAMLANYKRQVSVPSLLPDSIKSAWNEKQINMVVRSVAFLSCVFALVVMLVAISQKAVLWKMKKDLIAEVHGIQGRIDQSLLVLQGLRKEYRMLQPLIQAEEDTFAIISTLSAMQQIKTNGNGWMVLLADKDSYYAGDASQITNQVRATNAPPLLMTNQVNLRRGLILETVLNQEGETMREDLAKLVDFLKSRHFLYNADILPADTRRMLVDSNLVLTGKHFAISLELEAEETEDEETDAGNENTKPGIQQPVWRKLQPDVQVRPQETEESQP